MFYYFDPLTLKCAHMSSGRLVAGRYVEVEDGKNYPNLEILRLVTADGVVTIVEDEAALAAFELQSAQTNALKIAVIEIERWGDAAEFATGDEQQAAIAMAKEWRGYRFEVTNAKSLPLSNPPRGYSDE